MEGEQLVLPRGFVTTLEIHSSVINSTIWLQIWRPTGSTGIYTLVDEREYTTTGTGIETVSHFYFD